MRHKAMHSLGQGATEYLVLLAVVLIVALVSIALLGFFPGLASDSRETQSAVYWKSSRPFAILETGVFRSDRTPFPRIILVLQNIDATGTFTINNITLSTSAGEDVLRDVGSISPGETKSVRVPILQPISNAVGTEYEFNVRISYTSAYGTVNTQYGSKPITGRWT